MNVDILGLEAFLAIAQHGRFHKAARALHITQTALTRRLQHFEEVLGVRLVERTTRSVALTPLGENFLPQARRLLGELTAALVEIRETGKAERGDVTIACVPTVGIQYPTGGGAAELELNFQRACLFAFDRHDKTEPFLCVLEQQRARAPWIEAFDGEAVRIQLVRVEWMGC